MCESVYHSCSKDWITKDFAPSIKREVLQLQDIADKYQGRGSVQAQSILNFWYGYVYESKYEGEGEKVQERTMQIPVSVPQSTLDFQITPSLTRDLITIFYSLETVENQLIEFRLSDIFGNQHKYLILPSGNGSEEVDVSDLPNGLYISSLFQNGQLIKSIKVIVKD